MNPASYPTALSRSTGCENWTHGLLTPNQALYQTEPIRYMRQTRCRNIAGDALQEKRMLSSYAVTLSVQGPHRDLNPESPDRQSGGITNYPIRPLYMPACASSIYPQIYTRTLLVIKRKPNGQGEIRTHNVSSVTVLQTACFSHFAYLP